MSTLKKWRKKVEDLTGIKFQESLTGIRGRYSTRIFLFTDDDIKKFQEVVRLKNQLNLDNAILQAFAPEKETLKPMNERVELLEFIVMDLDLKVNAKTKQLHQENQSLKILVKNLEERISQFEEQAKSKKLFKKKN